MILLNCRYLRSTTFSDIKIRFFEIDETGKECWEDSAILEDLWHQVGIAFRYFPIDLKMYVLVLIYVQVQE